MYSGPHTTAIDCAKDVLKAAEKNSKLVKTIVLSLIKQVGQGSGDRWMKIANIPAGLELTLRGGSRLQTIYIYLYSQVDRHAVASCLYKAFNGKRP